VQGTSTAASQQQKTLAVSAQQQQSLPQLPAPLQVFSQELFLNEEF